jgi:YHS domain-containing protein
MRRLHIRTALLLGLTLRCAVAVNAQTEAPTPQAPQTPKPTECIADAKTAVTSAEFGGKTYHFKSEACKAEFLTDSERYSQLYDALLELKAQGKTLKKPKPLDNASQVPS